MALVSIARYRELTGDTTSSDGEVTNKLATAQNLVEEFLRRGLESAVRTETLKVYSDGYVYPRAVPVTVVPTGYASQLSGVALSGGQTTWTTALVDTDTATITYTGGWTSATVPTTVERGIARTAYERLNPSTDLPAGATSVRLGDAAVTFKTPSGSGLPGDTLVELRPYRRRRL